MTCPFRQISSGLPVSLSLVLMCSSCKESPVEPAPEHTLAMKGFTYTSFAANGFTLGSQSDAVGELAAQIGNDWIALTVFEYQRNDTASDIAPNVSGRNPVTDSVWSTSSTEDDLREGIRQARLHGMKVMLKPQVDLYTGVWRAAIRPDGQGHWVRSYTAIILKYARIAAETNAEMLCIGTEFVVGTQSGYSAQWRTVIDSIRHHYTGKLTYAANWSGASDFGISNPEFEQVEFWNSLDYIGIDSYYPLTDARTDAIPSFNSSITRMAAHDLEIASIANRFHMSVIITETGIQSVKGSLASPWDFSLGAAAGAIQDTSAQEFYYRVMIDALGKQQWCAGMFWWNWESVPSSNAATNYTPQNKAAARTLRQWYRLPTIWSAMQ